MHTPAFAVDPGPALGLRVFEHLARAADKLLAARDDRAPTCAERNGGDVLTFDRAALEPVAREVPVSLVP